MNKEQLEAINNLDDQIQHLERTLSSSTLHVINGNQTIHDSYKLDFNTYEKVRKILLERLQELKHQFERV